jgi:hypothetical protein
MGKREEGMTKIEEHLIRFSKEEQSSESIVDE